MKLNKSQVCMFLLYELMEGKHVSLKEYIERFNISISTFKKDIQELRAFLSNVYAPYTLEYSYKENRYYLAK